jgi:membrane protease subunit (stomatin/prohibitin family)
MKSLLDLPAQYGAIALGVKQTVRDEFAQYGIELVDLVVSAITVPDDVQQMLNRATGIAAQDADKYRSIAASDAIRDVARNTKGTGTNETLGAGLGLGMGFGVAKEFAQAFATPVAHSVSSNQESRSSDGRLTTESIRQKLSHLKTMHDDKLISDAEFEEHKGRILSQL